MLNVDGLHFSQLHYVGGILVCIITHQKQNMVGQPNTWIWVRVNLPYFQFNLKYEQEK